MKKRFWLFLLAAALLQGCGDIEWFPESTTTPTNTTTQPTLTMAVSPASVAAGSSSTLTFTITNATGNPAKSGLGFTALVDPLLSLTVPFSQCGGNAVGTGDSIVFDGGSLAAGTGSCTVTATVSSATPSNYTFKAAEISGLLGGLSNGAADQTLKITPLPSVTNGAVTVSIVNVTNAPFDPATPPTAIVTFNATVNSVNSSTGALNITIGLVALDANGTQLPATTNFVDAVADVGTTQFTVPLDTTFSDTGNIASWAITSVDII